jgi:acetoacetate decarboxylase
MSQQQLLPKLKHYPPWLCHGEAYILNYWASPQLLQQAKAFNLQSSRAGHVLHVILLRYQDTPIGPYDALFIVDHPVQQKQRYSSIAKIFVSTQDSILYGQSFWGLPKELAHFTWTKTSTAMYCEIRVANKSMIIQLNHLKNSANFYINSHQLPDYILTMQQHWQGHRYIFAPQFRGQLCKLKSVQWHDNANLFPNFNQARYIDSFYIPEVQLLLPEAKLKLLKHVSRETL